MVQSLLPLLSLIALIPFVSAHGQLRRVTIGDTTYDAPNIYFDGDARNANTPVRKGYKADFPSYLLPHDFSNDNKMSCEEAGAAPAVASAKPGDTVVFQWEGATTELDSAYGAGSFVHAMGPIMTYIGSCNGDCKSVDASQIGYQKIQYSGLNGGTIQDKLRSAMDAKPEPYRTPGVWALAQLIEDGSKYSATIPQGLEDGEYMLRSELSAVHNPFNGQDSSGPQNYVACVQIKIENGGGNVKLPSGTKAGSLYAPDGPLATYSVFTSPDNFPGDGPPMYDGASASGSNNNQGSQNQGNTNTDNNNGQQNQDQGNQNNGDNNGQQNQDQGNQNQQNQDQGNQNSGDNSNNGQQSQEQGDNSNPDNSNNGQQSQDQGNQNGGDNSGSSGKQCRRRRRRSVPKVARSLHAAHAKRHH